MKRKRGRVSLGTWLMLLVTALVAVCCVAFLGLIGGRSAGERAAFIQSLAEDGFAFFRAQEDAPVQPTAVPVTAAPVQTASPTPDPSPQITTVTLAAAGTVYAPKAIRQTVQDGANDYDFLPVLEGVREALSGADLGIVTLETLATGDGKSAGNYNAPSQLLDALRSCGVDLISLATERALDEGYDGLEMTVRQITSLGLSCVGVNPEGGEAGRATVMRIGGMQVAVLAYTYGLSDEGDELTDGDRLNAVAKIGTDQMVSDIAQARLNGANLVVVLPHWGTKNKLETPENVRALARTLAQAGADIILGTHPNVVQGIERLHVTRSDGLDYEAVVCYSLGTLLSDARSEENTAGVIARLTASYDPATRRVALGEVECTPIYIARTRVEDATAYRVIEADNEEALSALDESEQAAARRAAEIVAQATRQEEP